MNIQTKKLIPTGLNAVIRYFLVFFDIPYSSELLMFTWNLFCFLSFVYCSAAMLCFYSYVIISGGNPPPKKLRSSTVIS